MKQQRGRSNISSDPRRVRFCNTSTSWSSNLCNTTNDCIKAYPGQTFRVSVVTVGQMGGSTQGRINATLMNETYPSHILQSKGLLTTTDKCVNLSYVLKSNRTDHAQLSFAPETASRYCKITTADLLVRILPCPLGFQLRHTAPYVCSCDPFLSKFLTLYLPITCNINN